MPFSKCAVQYVCGSVHVRFSMCAVQCVCGSVCVQFSVCAVQYAHCNSLLSVTVVPSTFPVPLLQQAVTAEAGFDTGPPDGNGKGLCPSTSLFPCEHRSAIAPHLCQKDEQLKSGNFQIKQSSF